MPFENSMKILFINAYRLNTLKCNGKFQTSVRGWATVTGSTCLRKYLRRHFVQHWVPVENTSCVSSPNPFLQAEWKQISCNYGFSMGGAIPNLIQIRSLFLVMKFEHERKHVMIYGCMNIEVISIGYWIYWHNSELQIITALSLISTLYKSPRRLLNFSSLLCLNRPFPGNGF
jgi:hypothetical protein